MRNLLQPLFDQYQEIMTPADNHLLNSFKQSAQQRGVPESVIAELITFYSFTNGIPCLDGFDFYACHDEILFEWWEKQGVLWLGQRDFYVLRWANNRYCLGDASDNSFSKMHEFRSLFDLLKAAFEEWKIV